MKKVLIANRGEIAVRVIRACRDQGLTSVAVYADDDIDALYTTMADEAWALSGNDPASTYLDADKLMAIARQSGADSVHPGYGFLSESAAFARQVMAAGLTWIGPEPETIELLGNKVRARQLAEEAGAPLAAGTSEPVDNVDAIHAFVAEHGLPIIIKAAYGGGGRGMKVVHREEDIDALFDSAVREAELAFGRGECFVEQFLENPRHIEAQILADQYGQVQVVGTRDCSLQRRNQKLVEEAPAPFLTDEQRERIHQSARDICRKAGYINAGTVEFMLSQSGIISFLEVNTRLQVEHPVTEETTGIDLVCAQLAVARGEKLANSDVPTPRGHAFEFRINAEDVARGFLPSPGAIDTWRVPHGPGVRLDGGVVAGSQVAGQFDSLLAKLIVWGKDRPTALARARRALAEFTIEGTASVLPFHRQVVTEPDFVDTEAFHVHTRWIEQTLMNKWKPQKQSRPAFAGETPLQRVPMEIDGKRVMLGLPVGMLASVGQAADTLPSKQATPAGEEGCVNAPVAGMLSQWKVEDGAQVNEGDLIAVMEAMKMELPVHAPCTGRLVHKVQKGSRLDAGDAVARVHTSDSDNK